MKARLAVNALGNAVSRRDDVAGCIVHSERGSQFRSRTFVRALNRHQLLGSMGQVGAAGDNAAMESFFALLQKNIPGPQEVEGPRGAPDRDRHVDRAQVSPWGAGRPVSAG